MNNDEEIAEHESNTFLYIFFRRTHQRTENERRKKENAILGLLYFF